MGILDSTPPPRSLTGLLLAGAATFSVAAGLLHLAAVPEHWASYRVAAVFFIALGTFQVVWAALVIGRPSRPLYAAGAVASLGTIAVWAVSRTSGLPFGPFAGIAERAGRADIVSTVLEEALVVALILLAYGVGESRRYERPGYRAAVTALLATTGSLALWALTGLHAGVHAGALTGGAGALSQPGILSELAGHHGLHLLFAGGAVAVYFAYLVGYVRRNGWPSFSWKLAPSGSGSPRRAMTERAVFTVEVTAPETAARMGRAPVTPATTAAAVSVAWMRTARRTAWSLAAPSAMRRSRPRTMVRTPNMRRK
jgi:hypothetical protein